MASTLLLEVGVMFPVVAVCGVIVGRVGLSAVPFDIVAGIVYGSSSSIITTSLIGLGGLANSESEPIPAVTVGCVLVMSILGTIRMQYSGVVERLVPDRTGTPVRAEVAK